MKTTPRPTHTHTQANERTQTRQSADQPPDQPPDQPTTHPPTAAPAGGPNETINKTSPRGQSVHGPTSHVVCAVPASSKEASPLERHTPPTRGREGVGLITLQLAGCMLWMPPKQKRHRSQPFCEDVPTTGGFFGRPWQHRQEKGVHVARCWASEGFCAHVAF